MERRAGRGLWFAALGVCLALSLMACSSAVQRPFFVAEAGTMTKSLCFGVESLPGGFEVIGKEIYDNAAAARGTPDPAQRQRDYVAWGRVTGSFLQWAFEPPSAPAENADGTMSEAEIEAALERARQEMLETPFTGATCRVDLYETIEGARQAFAAEAGDLLSQPSTAEIERDLLGDESLFLVRRYDAPPISRFILIVRLQNVIGQITVSAPCDTPTGQPCAVAEDRTRSLGTLLLRRLAESAPLSTPVSQGEPAATDTTVRQEAERLCPERDYTGCVAAYLEHAQQPEPVALCRTEYGQWFFEPPAGRVGEHCADGEASIIAIVGGQ